MSLASFQRDLKGEDVTVTRRTMIGGDAVEFLLVCDGHGGATASHLCRAHMLERMIAEAESDGSSASLERAARSSIENVHRDVVATGSTAGTTVTVVAINVSRAELTVAHVGDSAALLVEAESETMLTEEHRLDDSPAERERVVAAGSTIGRACTADGYLSGPLRAYPGGLAVCRTVGDTDCVGASSEPYVHSRSFDAAAGAAIIVCSDGVWDALSPEKVAACVRRSRAANAAAEYVVEKAIKARGLRDDTSSVVAWLGIPPWDESRCENTRHRLGRDIGRKLSLAFGSRSPSMSPTGSPMASPIHSHLNLEQLGVDATPSEHTMIATALWSLDQQSRDGASVIKVSL